MILPHCENVVTKYKEVRRDGESTSSAPTTNTTTTNSSPLHESRSEKVEKKGDKSTIVLKEDVNGITDVASASTSTSNNASDASDASDASNDDDDELETASTPILFPVDLPTYVRSSENTQPSVHRRVAPSTLLKSSRNIFSQQWKKVMKGIFSLKKQVCYDQIEQV